MWFIKTQYDSRRSYLRSCCMEEVVAAARPEGRRRAEGGQPRAEEGSDGLVVGNVASRTGDLGHDDDEDDEGDDVRGHVPTCF